MGEGNGALWDDVKAQLKKAAESIEVPDDVRNQVRAQQAQQSAPAKQWADTAVKAVSLAGMGGYPAYAERYLKIRDKSGDLKALAFKPAQLELERIANEQLSAQGYVRIIVLKARQMGISTYIAGRGYWKTTRRTGQRAYILAHELAASGQLFKMVKGFQDNIDFRYRPHTQRSNAKELIFDLMKGGYTVGTAKQGETGRSFTVQFFHGCIGHDVPLLLADGRLIRVGDARVGDLVRTHTGVVAPISFVSDQVKPVLDARLASMQSLPLIATPEHRFWTRSGWKQIGQIEVGEAIGFPVPQIDRRVTHLLFRLPDSRRPQGGGRREIGPDTIEAGYELGRVLGLYLAEGSIASQRKAPHEPAAVTFTVHRREVARTRAWLDPLKDCFRSVKVVDRPDCLTSTVTVYGRSFATLLASMCGRKDEKRFPVAWRNMGRDFGRGLVHGYLAGDGHCSAHPNDRRISIPSVRPATITALRDALAALGYGWAGISRKPAGLRNGRREREQWVLRLSGPGVDHLSAELGWKMAPRRRCGEQKVTIDGGYAWLPLIGRKPAGEQPVRDFEVAHADRSYCLLMAGTKNSEVGFWPSAEQIALGLLQTVGTVNGTEIWMESTGNGMGNYFHSAAMQARKGEGDFRLAFLPWFWDPDYSRPFLLDADREKLLADMSVEDAQYMEAHEITPEQMHWRAVKIQEFAMVAHGNLEIARVKFAQEYPATVEEAFSGNQTDSYVQAMTVLLARKAWRDYLKERPRENRPPGYGPKRMGIDPSWIGNDGFRVWMRQGRVAWRAGHWNRAKITESYGRVMKIIQREQPDEIYVDAIGVGAGLYDMLSEAPISASVIPVLSGDAADEPDRYFNKRSEMTDRVREWLTEAPQAMLEDIDEIQADLTSIRSKADQRARVRIESKDEMRKRGLPSPDDSDALALTFAYASPSSSKRGGKGNAPSPRRDVFYGGNL